MKRSFLKVTQLTLIGCAVCGLVVPTLAIEGVGQPSTVTVECVNAITGELITDEQGIPITTTIETKDDSITLEAEDISGYKVVGDSTQSYSVEARNNVARIGYLPDDSLTYRNYRVEYILTDFTESSRNGEFISDPVVYTNVDVGDVNTEPAKVEGFNYVRTETAEEDDVWVVRHLYNSTEATLPNKEGTYKILAYDENHKLLDVYTGEAPLKNSKVNLKNYDGYTNASGASVGLVLSHKTPSKTVEVNYTYTGAEQRPDKATITLRYLDVSNNNSEVTTKQLEVDFGEEVKIEIPTIDGYKNETTSLTVTTTLLNPTKSVDVKCDKIINGVTTIKTVDKATGLEIAPATTQTHELSGEYKISAPSINNYTLVGDAEQTVNVTEQNPNNTVTFYYTKNVAPVTKGSITIQYKDLNGNKIIEDKVLSDLAFGSHTVKAEVIDKYELVGDSEKVIELSKDNVNPIVVFEYKLIPTGGGTLTPDEGNKPSVPDEKPFTGSVVVRYVDTDGNLICAEETYSNLEAGSYTYTAKSFDGYVLESNQKMSFILNADNPSRTVEFVYRRADISGKISILFIDNETGETIQTSQIYDGLGAGVYTYSAPNIQGYRLISSGKASTELSYSRNSANIVFRYSKVSATQNTNTNLNSSKKGTIVLKYVDEETNEEIKDSVSYKDLDLKEYTYSAVDITGYELVSSIDQKVTLDANNLSKEIVFKYKKAEGSNSTVVDNENNSSSSTSENLPSYTNKELNGIQALPLSVKIIAVVGLIALVLLVVTIIVKASSRKRNFNDEDYDEPITYEYLE